MLKFDEAYDLSVSLTGNATYLQYILVWFYCNSLVIAEKIAEAIYSFQHV